MNKIIFFFGLAILFYSCLPLDPGISDQMLQLRADVEGGHSPIVNKRGDLLLFISSYEGNNTIWITNSDGTNKELLYSSKNNLCCLSFSPSGKYILYNEENPDGDIYRMNIDGTRRVALTSNSIPDSDPVWTLDDNVIFTSMNDNSENANGIYKANYDGTDRIQLNSSDFEAFYPVVSNNGEYILGHHTEVEGDVNIYRWNVSTGERLQLTESDSADWHPAWSPSDELIVYRNNRHGSWDLYSVRPDGTDIRRLTDRVTEDISPQFSPCGNYILYLSRKTGDDKYDLWIMKNDGSNKRRLTKDSFDNTDPVWSPDGSQIYYTSMVDDVPQVVRINFDGSEKTLITSKELR